MKVEEGFRKALRDCLPGARRFYTFTLKHVVPRRARTGCSESAGMSRRKLVPRLLAASRIDRIYRSKLARGSLSKRAVNFPRHCLAIAAGSRVEHDGAFSGVPDGRRCASRLSITGSPAKVMATSRRKPMNSFLKWAGSKRKSLPKLLASLPPTFERYVEPFAGSACLFFQLEPQHAMLADINAQLIETYEELRDRTDEVIRALSCLNCDETEYYRIRSADQLALSGADRAARFIYLNRFCFNGLYRTNRSGKFNVPYGGKRGGRLPSSEALQSCAKALKGVTLRAASFEETLGHVQTGDFVYLDPPYSIRSRRVFSSYSGAVFGSEQLKTLRSNLRRLDRMNVPFLVSYGQSEEAFTLARGFRSRQMVVQRQIAGFAANRRKSRELVITNY